MLFWNRRIVRFARGLFWCLPFLLMCLESAVAAEPRVCFGAACVSVELAVTEKQKQQGLMYRAQLDQDRGMLFIFFEQDRWGFWMKNTLIPLDIIWLDEQKRVVDYTTAQPAAGESDPVVYKPRSAAKFVLETNAGWIKAHQLQIGDVAVFDGFVDQTGYNNSHNQDSSS